MRKSLVPVTIAIHPIQSTDQMEMNPGRASAYKKISATEPCPPPPGSLGLTVGSSQIPKQNETPGH